MANVAHMKASYELKPHWEGTDKSPTVLRRNCPVCAKRLFNDGEDWRFMLEGVVRTGIACKEHLL